MQLEPASVCPAMRSAAPSLGSLLSMLECTLSVTSMSRARAQLKKELAFGKRDSFHSQPFQSLGAFQSVSSERVSSGTLWDSNAGIQRSFDGAARVRGVVRVPDAELISGKERRGSGELSQGLESSGVVVTVGEEVAVLEIAVGRSGLHPALARPDRGAGVVQQAPAGPVEKAIGNGRLDVGLAGRALLPLTAGGIDVVGVGVEATDPAAQGISWGRSWVRWHLPGRQTGCRCWCCTPRRPRIGSPRRWYPLAGGSWVVRSAHWSSDAVSGAESVATRVPFTSTSKLRAGGGLKSTG